MKMLKNRKGFGLIELTLALAITAVVGFVVLRAYTQAQDAKTAQGIASDIGIVHSAVKTVFGTQRDYLNLNIQALKDSLPKSMTKDLGGGAEYVHLTGGGAMSVSSAQINNTVGIQDVVGYGLMLINDNTCNMIATSDMGREAIAMAINGEIRGLPQTGGGVARFTPQEAQTICTWGNQNTSTGGVGNQITIYMR